MKDLLNFSLINIDKPAGPTSFSVSHYVGGKLGLSKTSHMGTLDPGVTGVLPITLGRACKLAAYFIRHDKTYVGILHTHKAQKIEELQKLIDENFVGKIKQTPPHRSSVKRAERERAVYFWKLIEADENGKDFLFETRVEGGTYIRKLCSDLGEMIGGAHMAELRRTEAGIFNEESLVSLYEFDSAVEEWKSRGDDPKGPQGNEKALKKMLVPAEDAIKKVLPSVEVEKRVVAVLMTGKPLFKEDVVGKVALKDGEDFAAFCGKKFVGVYKKVENSEIFGKAEFVYN